MLLLFLLHYSVAWSLFCVHWNYTLKKNKQAMMSQAMLICLGNATRRLYSDYFRTHYTPDTAIGDKCVINKNKVI